MFRKLPPFSMSDAEIKTLADSMIEPAGAFDNPDIPAAYTYLGQFIDHDVTFDATSDLQGANDPDQIENFRTPRFDLDSVYGVGPEDSLSLYDKTRFGYLLVGRQGDASSKEKDLPRNEQEIAIIGDARNDENVIVSQLHLAFIRFHNAVLAAVSGGDPLVAFREAQRLVRWHYEWIVVHDFLKRVAGADRVRALLDAGSSLFDFRDAPFMPVEFSVAAYRFGHSMARNAYHLNDKLDLVRGPIDGGNVPIFVPQLPANLPELADLRGRKALPRGWTIQWDRFLDVAPAAPAQRSRLIDTQISSALAVVPGFTPPEVAVRNLKRGVSFGLPSGERVAKAMGLDVPPGGERPLWYYVLQEAETTMAGRRLGAVGARIVAEVFIGLLRSDPLSYLSVQPEWRPTLPDRTGVVTGEFELVDLLAFAGAPLTVADLPF
jgi:hypothetical protein